MQKRLLCLLLAISCLFLSISCGRESSPHALEIRFLDVGQGDATLLRTSVGDILIDASTDAEQERLCLHLENLGVDSLVLAVFTHSDEDHIGGADGVLRRFPTETVWISEFFEDGECTRALHSAAEDTGADVVRVSSRVSHQFGDVTLSVLSPIAKMNGATVNDQSIVLKLAIGNVSALFMGDAEAYTEALLLERYARTLLDCDLLKVGHHGAETSSGEKFLKAVRPQYAVISCGEGNEYGHPHGETLARLEAVGSTALRTDLMGDVVFFTNGTDIHIENELQ